MKGSKKWKVKINERSNKFKGSKKKGLKNERFQEIKGSKNKKFSKTFQKWNVPKMKGSKKWKVPRKWKRWKDERFKKMKVSCLIENDPPGV